MKVTFELTSIDEIETVVAALKGRNTQAAMNLVPKTEVGTVSMKAVHEESGEEVTVSVPAKAEPAKRGRKPKNETVEAPAAEVQSEPKNEATETEAEAVSTVEPQEGDIDDAKMREIGGKLLRELNAQGKDGVATLTQILSSLGSKKVTEVPMNLRPRFVAKVEEALA